MELISIEESRIINLFIASVKDKEQPFVLDTLDQLKERYQFQVVPNYLEDDIEGGLHFRLGKFNGQPINNYEIYNDGVVVSSNTNTEILDLFIKDLEAWMNEEFGLIRIETHEINQVYESQILVKSERNILKTLDQLEPLQKLISQELKATTSLEVDYAPYGFSLGIDTSKLPGMKPIKFQIERRNGLAFENNYYACLAPLPTDKHIELLTMLEGLV